MSATGRWRPIVDMPPGGSLHQPLVNLISERYFNGNKPTANNGWDRPAGGFYSMRMDGDAITMAWLQGLADGGVDEAAELLVALEEHGAVELWFVN